LIYTTDKPNMLTTFNGKKKLLFNGWRHPREFWLHFDWSNVFYITVSDASLVPYLSYKRVTRKKKLLFNLLTFYVQYRERSSMINHCDKHLPLLSNTDKTFGLFNLFTYFDMDFGWTKLEDTVKPVLGGHSWVYL
jgi:hypothetical protein